jgi:hypothetical protein
MANTTSTPHETTEGEEGKALKTLSTTLPLDVIAKINKEAKENYPIKPAQIVRRIVVQHYENQPL